MIVSTQPGRVSPLILPTVLFVVVLVGHVVHYLERSDTVLWDRLETEN